MNFSEFYGTTCFRTSATKETPQNLTKKQGIKIYPSSISLNLLLSIWHPEQKGFYKSLECRSFIFSKSIGSNCRD